MKIDINLGAFAEIIKASLKNPNVAHKTIILLFVGIMMCTTVYFGASSLPYPTSMLNSIIAVCVLILLGLAYAILDRKRTSRRKRA